ncbi:AAA domain-containing protein [Novosphingobium mangrovi (ex Hu et al. 2023)]|uniref:AAA family ATPase n=1 Tax=Novosphingobium mangrovi (ex Hu et al. 2023) TaxID=2930094 RepID=A0ABT0AEJ0_9SPHN|nr:AAA domain-containing protein [Novosphingobium mangrovi (ex Hu et al. 2023)]MCJ1961611.1 AAA family ATPase [Novosphingobium mangrovi (ex Hu et al. 2023)]
MEAEQHSAPVLDQVCDELGHRDTDRADRLSRHIASIKHALKSGEPVRSAPPTPIQAEFPDLTPAGDVHRDEVTTPESRTQLRNMLRAVRERKAEEPDEDTRTTPSVTLDRTGDHVQRPDPHVVSRMIDLIDYVVAVEKDKLKIVTDVAQHGAFRRDAAGLANLPGVHLNAVDGGEVAWLKVERLSRVAPPVPDGPALKVWAVLVDDPAKKPRLRDSITASECVRAGLQLQSGQNSLRLSDLDECGDIEAAFAGYLAGPWEEWSTKEGPRREAIALYSALFSLRTVLGAPDGAPQEFVCGIGFAALLRDDKRLNYPLLTVPLDIELDHKSHTISLVPREEVAPSVEVDPLDVLGLKHVDDWRKQARQLLDGLADSPLTPFAAETYEPILRLASSVLDPNARYVESKGKVLSPPVPGAELVVSDAFGFFQRERRATQLMADLRCFRELLEGPETSLELPGAVEALFSEPSDDVAHEDFPTFRGINAIPGVTSSNGEGADLFFPKPFNGEQVQIAQRLAVRDGVVVQGPPGTGKTHTIANIISHYLASGKRVLVTSQKTPALQVLRAQLPVPIQPLAVSLLDSDREGLRQFRASVDHVAERLQNMRRADLDREIEDMERRVDGLHKTLAQLDFEIDKLGRTALQPVSLDGQAIPPLKAANEVMEAGDAARWIEDAITPDERFAPRFAEEDIAICRDARAAVGDLIDYLGKQLPPGDLLEDVDGICAIHSSLLQAEDIKARISDGALWGLVDETAATLEAVASVQDRLAVWTEQRDSLGVGAPAWDSTLEDLLASPSEPLLTALEELEAEAVRLAEEHAWFLTRPVTIPNGALSDPKFIEAVHDLRDGGQGISGFAGLFARRTKQMLADVRLRGKAPDGPEHWADVTRFISSNDDAHSFSASWNHACAGTGLPELPLNALSAGREAVQVLFRLGALKRLHSDAVSLSAELRKLLPEWSGSVDRNADTSATLYCLRLHLDRGRLSRANEKRRKLLAALEAHDTPLHEDMRQLANQLGSGQLSEAACRDSLLTLLRRSEHLHGLQRHFDDIARISEAVASSGGVSWAERLRTRAVNGEDLECPGDWRRRWRLRRLATWLDASQSMDAFMRLHGQRREAEGDLARTYTRLIELRTWRELKSQASPKVMAALSAYAVAVGKIGRGTGKNANRHRKTAQHAANAVKGALPCWIMPHHRVSESLPAELGIFDLVIVDEASQSTLAALPALFRAHQILVVGDDKQVSPDNVGLAMDQANARAARYLSEQVALYRAPMREEASFYDLASVIFGNDNLMLREHFRCAAPIIEFSKRQFYRNELRPLRLSKPSERLDPVLVDVRVTDGYRKGKTNPPEADFIVSELRRMGDDPAFDGRTFGVTTLLGTEQAALIYKRIEDELGIPFIEKYHVRVGDPAKFQGDERDVMFLSLVVTKGHANALSGLGFEQRFNVAASRARERMVLVRSIELEELSQRDALRRALLEHFRCPFPADEENAQDARARCESGFEREMFDALTTLGYSVDTQVKVGAHRIDMVVEGDDDRRLAIECDGDRYHGPEQWPADMARQRTLERAGWTIWRCFASRFVRERQTVIDELLELLKSMGIQPRTSERRSRVHTSLREWSSGGDGDLAQHDTELAIASISEEGLASSEVVQ